MKKIIFIFVIFSSCIVVYSTTKELSFLCLVLLFSELMIISFQKEYTDLKKIILSSFLISVFIISYIISELINDPNSYYICIVLITLFVVIKQIKKLENSLKIARKRAYEKERRKRTLDKKRRINAFYSEKFSNFERTTSTYLPM